MAAYKVKVYEYGPNEVRQVFSKTFWHQDAYIARNMAEDFAQKYRGCFDKVVIERTTVVS